MTDFYGRNEKNYGLKNQSYYSGSQMGPFELQKVKNPSQYWFHISTTWWSVSTLMCCSVMWTRKNSNFPSRLSMFILLFKVLLYILHFFVLLSGICFFFFLSTWIVTDKINALFSINSTNCYEPFVFYCSWSNYISCSLILRIWIVLPSNETE